MRVYGIDVGKNGGISWVDDEGNGNSLPFSEENLKSVFCENRDAVCYVENVHAMPNQGVTSMFNFGQNFGYILGVLDAYGVIIKLVSPQKWKNFYIKYSNVQLGRDKELSIALAGVLFPQVSLFKSPRCKKRHDGMAESLLIAKYGLEQEKNK